MSGNDLIPDYAYFNCKMKNAKILKSLPVISLILNRAQADNNIRSSAETCGYLKLYYRTS